MIKLADTTKDELIEAWLKDACANAFCAPFGVWLLQNTDCKIPYPKDNALLNHLTAQSQPKPTDDRNSSTQTDPVPRG